MEQNVDDFTQAASTSASPRTNARDSAAASRIRRRKTVTLVEELSIRTQKVQPLDEEAGADLARGWTSWSSRSTS